mgnify:FL=1
MEFIGINCCFISHVNGGSYTLVGLSTSKEILWDEFLALTKTKGEVGNYNFSHGLTWFSSIALQ